MSHKFEISATITKTDGSEFYHELHRWGQADDEMLAWLNKELSEFTDKSEKESGKKDDGANFTVTFRGFLDGAALPDVCITDVSYKSVVKMEREWHRLGDKLIKIGEDKAKGKK